MGEFGVHKVIKVEDLALFFCDYVDSSLVGNCNGKHENLTSQFRISAVQQTNYYFSEFSVIANIVIFLMCQNVGMLACQIVIVWLLFMG